MKKWLVILATLFTTSAFAGELQERVGAPTLRTISHSEEILATSTNATMTFVVEGKTRQALLTAVLSEESYIFDRQKRCHFVPDVELRFRDGSDEVQVFLSTTCNQIKFMVADQAVILDNDPVAESVNLIIQEVIGA